MSEAVHETGVAYWNMLYSAPIDEQLGYIEQLTKLADVVVLTECTSEVASHLRGDYEHVDTDERMTFQGQTYGMAVLSRYPVEVDRRSPWQAISYDAGFMGPYDDHRDYVRFVVEHGSLGPMAIFGAHVSHPHHVWRPSIGIRRITEWRQHAQALAEEELPFLWMADTNTMRAQTVSRRLGLASIKGMLLPHEGDATWGPSTNGHKKLLYLDRVAVSKELADRARLVTLGGSLGGVACPSDHRALLTVVE